MHGETAELSEKCLVHALLHVVVLGVRVVELVLGSVKPSEGASAGANERVGALLVGRSLPEHAAAEVLGLDIANLGLDHVGGVVRDELLLAGIVRVVALSDVVVHDGSASLGESLVVPDAVLPRALSDAAVGLPDAVSLLESASVDGHAENDLVGGNATLDVGGNGVVGVEGGGIGVAGVLVDVGVVAASVAPGSGVVVSHQVDPVKDLAELVELEDVEVLGAGGSGDGELKVVAIGVLSSVAVELGAHGLEEQDHVGGLGGILGVLPVNINTVEAPVLDERDGRLGKVLAVGVGACSRREVCGPGPAANGKHDLELAVGLLELVELLDAAVDVGADVVPRVVGVVLVGVGVGIARVDGAVLLYVHEGVEDVRDLASGKVGRLEVASVDAPRRNVSGTDKRAALRRGRDEPVGEVDGVDVAAATLLEVHGVYGRGEGDAGMQGSQEGDRLGEKAEHGEGSVVVVVV